MPEKTQANVRHTAQLLTSTPFRTRYLAQRVGVSKDTIERYIHDLKAIGWVRKVEGTCYYQIVSRQYHLSTPPNPAKISLPLFRTLPLIENWYANSRGNRYRLRLLADFYRVTTGKLVPSFAVLPEQWVYPDTPNAFLSQYMQAHNSLPPKDVLKAIRAFLHECLNVSRPTLQLYMKQWRRAKSQ
jgi:hypothetical protein